MDDSSGQQSESQFFEVKKFKYIERFSRQRLDPDTKSRGLKQLEKITKLEGICIASTVTDGWELDPARITGQQVHDGAGRRGSEIRQKAQARHAAWQKEATEIWAKNTGLSNTAVAKLIGKVGRRNWNTIRRHIQRPK